MKKSLFKFKWPWSGMLTAFLLLTSLTGFTQTYCKVKGVNSVTRKLWIERSLIGNISNVSGNNNGYADFSAVTQNVTAGSNVPFTIETGRLLLSKLFYANIYIDANNDGDFSDAGELVLQDTARGILNGSFTVPANAVNGQLRVRVGVKRLGFAPDCGFYFLGETEDYSLNVSGSNCVADAGTLTATSSVACTKGGTATISATPNGNAVVPPGYQTLYVLTEGPGLVIQQVSPLPSFSVTGGGNFTIHTLIYDPLTLNLGIVVPGVTTGFDVNALLIQGGGSICASLDVTGAPILINNPDAGTLTAVNSTICGNGGVLTATPDGNSNVPAGYSTLYVLTSGSGLVIEQVSATPSFNVTGSGLYTIHTLVYDSTLDLSIVVPGVTTGFDVNGLLVQGGGSICASLDVAGAQFNITNPDAGTLTAVNSTICGNGGLLTATPDGNSNVPAGYSTIYVLTSGTGLVIEQVSATPSFNVTGSGLYTIHTLVFDSTLDLSIVVPGVTTGFDVNGLLVQGGGTICASLDVAGAQFNTLILMQEHLQR
jgi:GEVED domain